GDEEAQGRTVLGRARRVVLAACGRAHGGEYDRDPAAHLSRLPSKERPYYAPTTIVAMKAIGRGGIAIQSPWTPPSFAKSRSHARTEPGPTPWRERPVQVRRNGGRPNAPWRLLDLITEVA